MAQQIELPQFLKDLQLEPPEFVRELLQPGALAQMEPSKALKVTMDVSPRFPAVGRGQLLTLDGSVTLFGVIGLPAFLVVQATKRPEELAKPIAAALTLPFTGTFSIPIPTEEWEYGDYGFQVLAFAFPGPPGLSEPKFTTIEPVRFAATVTMEVPEATSPLTIYRGELPRDVYVDYTVKNAGNIDADFAIDRSLSPLYSATRYTWVAMGATFSPTDPGDSIVMPDLALNGYYDGVVTVSHDGIELARDTKTGIVYIRDDPSYTATLTGVTWTL